MAMNEDNVWYVRDDDEFQYQGYDFPEFDEFFRDLYRKGVRYVCVLKFGEGRKLNPSGKCGVRAITMPEDLLEKLWKECDE